MTGIELLDSVIKQFQVVYLGQPLLDALLAQALRVYQNKAGPFTDVTFPADATEIDIPVDFMGVAVAMDSNGRWQEARKDNGKIKILVNGQIVQVQPTTLDYAFPVGPTTNYYGQGRVADTTAVKPYRLFYFQKLLPDGELPDESISLLFQYLSAMIEIPNNRRAREVANATGMTMEFPDDDQLKQRADLIEQEMEDTRGMIPTAAVF